jgi:hypothetical protein
MKEVELKGELLQLGVDTKGLKAELVRRLTEARREGRRERRTPGRSSAVQRPFQLGRWVGGSQEVIFNTTNPTAHKHTRHALDWAFWGWV